MDYGRIAYEAYRADAGLLLPDWDDLTPDLQQRWRAAAAAVLDAPYLHPETKPEG